MPDSLAERLKKLAEQQSLGQAAVRDARSLQEQANAFISDNARPEYEKLLASLRSRIEQVNPDIGSLPPFQFAQGGMITQGNCVAFLHFDKPIVNRSENQLLVSFGPHPNNMYFLSEPPPASRYRLSAAATDSLDGIVWLGDLGELTSDQLSDFILENLTSYYLEHKPR